jgi:hypothetical protein
LAYSFIEILGEVEELFKSHQLDGLNNTGVANNRKASLGVFALFGKLNQNT